MAAIGPSLLLSEWNGVLVTFISHYGSTDVNVTIPNLKYTNYTVKLICYFSAVVVLFRLSRFDVVITTYNIVNMEGAACEDVEVCAFGFIILISCIPKLFACSSKLIC